MGTSGEVIKQYYAFNIVVQIEYICMVLFMVHNTYQIFETRYVVAIFTTYWSIIVSPYRAPSIQPIIMEVLDKH